MTQAEIHTLEYAARSAMAWAPEAIENRPRYANLLGALVPSFLILAAVALLFAAI